METTMALMPAAREALTRAPADTVHPVTRLAVLHTEARETARLANLLGRSAYTVLAFPAMTLATLALSGLGAGLLRGLVWTVFMAVATGAILIAYRRAIGQPFERAALKSFSQDLSATLVFASFAWGAGAYLALAPSSAIGTPALFVTIAAAAIGLLLREREMAFLFLAPAAVLTAIACVLRPMSGGVLDAALVLVASAIVAGMAVLAERMRDRAQEMPELAGLPTA
jgi:hypothetical protein